MGDAQRKVSREKTVRKGGKRREGYRKFPPLSCCFFFLHSSFHFTLQYLNAWNKQEISGSPFVCLQPGGVESLVKGCVEELVGPPQGEIKACP